MTQTELQSMKRQMAHLMRETQELQRQILDAIETNLDKVGDIPFDGSDEIDQEEVEFQAMGFAGNYSGPLYARHPDLHSEILYAERLGDL